MTPTITCVVDACAEVGEGPVWDDRAQVLWWVDIMPGLLHRFTPPTGEDRTWPIGEPVGCLAVREAGGLVLALQSGFWFFDPEAGKGVPVVNPEVDRPGNRFNDGTTDSQGRFWAGSMKLDPPAERTGAFYRLDADRSCRRWKDGVFTTNGMAFSPDGRTMYFSDSHPDVRTIWAADYDPDTGEPSAERVFFDTAAIAGRPDGGTVDSDGCYWMAGVGGWQVLRITPAGVVDRVINMPVERPSKPMFGGPDLKTLYVTSIARGLTAGTEAKQPQAGGLFAITGTGASGVAQARYRG